MASKNLAETLNKVKPKRKNNLTVIFLKTLPILGAMLLLFGKFSVAQAATLLLSPANGNFSVGNNFNVSVVVSTNQAMNAAEGIVSFPADKLEVISVSKTNSIFSLWVQEPSFSNFGLRGNVHFEGIKLNPGFTGNNGRILDITFRVKSAGIAEVSFDGGSILANDGKASNIISSFGSAIYTLRVTPRPDVSVSPTTPGQLDAPYLKHFIRNAIGEEILFNTSDDPVKWSAINYAKFTWRLPAGATGVATLLDEQSETNPGNKPDADGLAEEKLFPLLTEGKHYFHIRFLKGQTVGPVLHYPLFVDATAPKNFNIEFASSEVNYRGIYSTSNPRPRLAFFTEDQLSGVDYYQIKIGDGPAVNAMELAESPAFYVLPRQSPDKKQLIIVRAFDQAGNATEATAQMIITPIIAPTITYYSKYITSPGEKLVIEGKSSPQAYIEITLRSNDDSQMISAKADEKGDWQAVAEQPLPSGTYTVTAKQIVNDGAESSLTPPVYIRINFFGARILRFLTNFGLQIVIIIALAAQALMYRYYRRRMKKYRQTKNPAP